MQVELLAMGQNHIQVGALSSGTRMATSPMPNTGPIAVPHQSAMSLYGLLGTTLCTTMPGNHYPNYTVVDHERRNSKNIRCTLSPDLSMKILSPSSAKI